MNYEIDYLSIHSVLAFVWHFDMETQYLMLSLESGICINSNEYNV